MSVVERTIDKLRRTSASEGLPADAIGVVGTTRRPDTGLATPPDNSSEPKLFVDRVALRMAGYLPESDQDRRFADEYRQIKRPLIATAFAASSDMAATTNSPRLIMMASALPGDGKTFTSINLALSLARERDTTVVLVDGDVAKPHVSRIFGVESEPGLLDALTNSDLDVTSLVLPSDVRGLSILPAGKVTETATEYLASDRMAILANQIITRNPRCIALFDSSPLLVSSESLALSAVMGQIVLVVRAGQTPRQAVGDAIEALGPDKDLKLVLNQGRRGLTESRYGYAYGTYGEDSSG